MSRLSRATVAVGAVALTLALAACASASSGGGTVGSAPGTTPRAAGGANPNDLNGAWTTYHADNSRTGIDPSGAQLNPIHQAWVSPNLDGKVYASPLVWQGLVIVATENDTVYGLHATDGTVAWSTHIGSAVPQSRLPCGDIDPEGVTATPVIDPTTGHLFVVGETGGASAPVSHVLAALDAATGATLFQESADPSGMDASTQQERGALAIANGRVYVPFGGLYGDCGNYHGYVVAAPTSGPGALLSYQVPTQREGAVWAPPGMSVDASGNVLIATGNGSSTTTYDHGNSVIKLSPTLTELDSFAPSNWAADNSADSDLGSTAPVPVGNFVFQVGKESTGYLLDAGHLGGIGGQVFSANVCFVIGGTAAFGSDVYVPCRSGIKDVRVTASPPSFQVVWSAPSAVTGSPVIAGGLLWAVSGSTLYGLNASNGTVAQQANLPSAPEPYSTPAVGDGLLVVGTGTSVTAFAGPAGVGGGNPQASAAAYWMTASDGGVFNFGHAPFHGSAGSLPLRSPVVGMAATPDGGGYWLDAADGGVFNFGDAAFHGSAGSLPLRSPVVGMARTPDGGGYWLDAADGGVFNFGDAAFHGSAGSLPLRSPVVGMAATPDGGGYWLVAADGGVFNFGDAAFHGSAGSLPLRSPVVGMAATPDGGGYWLVAADGGIFTFGDAGFHGSAGSLPLRSPVVGMAATPDGGGYYLVASDGGLFTYGDAVFAGSMGGTRLNAPMVGMAAAK